MTLTLAELKKENETKLDLLFKECGVFFAFSNDQFNENKTPLADGDKYVSMGAGGYLPKSKVDAYIQGSKDINKGFKAGIKKSKSLRYENIAYELANHEAYYTGEITDTLEALGSEYTAKEVWEVYNKEAYKYN